MLVLEASFGGDAGESPEFPLTLFEGVELAVGCVVFASFLFAQLSIMPSIDCCKSICLSKRWKRNGFNK